MSLEDEARDSTLVAAAIIRGKLQAIQDDDHRGALESMMLELTMQDDPLMILSAVAQFAAVLTVTLAAVLDKPPLELIDLFEAQLRKGSDGNR